MSVASNKWHSWIETISGEVERPLPHRLHLFHFEGLTDILQYIIMNLYIVTS